MMKMAVPTTSPKTRLRFTIRTEVKIYHFLPISYILLRACRGGTGRKTADAGENGDDSKEFHSF